MIERRTFVQLLGGAAATTLSLPTLAQQAAVPVIGYLGAESPILFAGRLKAFHAGLATLGFAEGRNLIIEYCWAEGDNDRLPALAAELVRRDVAVLATPGSLAAALAAKRATETIPIVFETGADPIATGLVTSLRQPGGKTTGVTSLNAAVGGKRLELLRELFPNARSFALLVNPSNPKNAEASTADLQVAARTLGCELHVLNASTEGELDGVFTSLGKLQVAGLVIANETFFAMRSDPLAALARRYAIPAVHQAREFAVAGGLMSYGGSVAESHGQAGIYVGRILKGEKPGELPVVQVTKVEMVVNMKTAKALGITVPLAMLGRADEVIE
jgi:putative tryptophan/tyrosine transport system substrate-binding protein